ncbi:MAG: hypothetical protein AB1546_11320 [bacterium]
MSTKINLYFAKFEVPELKDLDLHVLRLYCDVQFITKDGYTEPYPAIIDTGAPTSLIPQKIWKTSIYSKLKEEYEIQGIVPLRRCSLKVSVGKISGMFIDRDNHSKEISFVSYLARTDRIPLILGFKDILEKCKIFADYNSKKAYIEF